MRYVAPMAVTAIAALMGGPIAVADSSVDRGRYLVQIMLCADCHSPLSEEGGPDLTRALAGGLGFEMPGLGIFWAPNLTPDQTGLAEWSEEEIVTAIRTGVRPDGRELAPIMPSGFFASLTDDDAAAIARYLKSIPPIEHKVPDPVGPGGKAEAPYMTLVVPTAPKS